MFSEKMLSHTPPSISMSIGREPSPMKKTRTRSGSISGRLRSASELVLDGLITEDEKTQIKELIIRNDERAEEAMERVKAGDNKMFRQILQNSMCTEDPYDMEGLNADFLNIGGPGSLGSNGQEFFSFEIGLDSYQDGESFKDEPGLLSAGSGSLKKESNASMFSLELDDSRTPESVQYSSRPLHKDSLAAIDENDETFMRNMNFWEPFQDDYTEHNILGGDHSSTIPMAIPTRGRNNSYMSAVSSTSFERTRNEAQSSSRAKPTNKLQSGGRRVQNTIYQTEKKKTTRKTQNNGPKRNNNRGQRTTKQEAQVAHPANQYERAALPADLIDRPSVNGRTGAYTTEARHELLKKFLEKRHRRTWKKKVKYDVRKNFADSRLRVKGRFVKKEDEQVLREFMLMTI